MASAYDLAKGAGSAFVHKGAYEEVDGQVRDTRATGPVSIKEPRTPVIAFLSPPAIYQAVVAAGAEKARQPWWKTLWLAVLAGIYLSFGGVLAYAVGGQMPQVQTNNPGIQHLIFGAFGLPFGLALILICGGELYTSNAAYMPAAFFEGRANLFQVARNWILSFFGNLAGSLIVVWLVDETYLFNTAAGVEYPITVAEAKTAAPFSHEILRGFFCNYMVCLGVWQATSAQDIIGKIFGIFFPGVLAYSVGGQMPQVQTNNPGIQHLIFGAFGLPFGLALILICGGELYTSNAAYMPAAFFEGRANLFQVARNWVLSFFGNLAGSLIVVWLVDETYLFNTAAGVKYPITVAEAKTAAPFSHEILRGFFCNYMVCLGVWQATGAQDIIGKIFGIFFPGGQAGLPFVTVPQNVKHFSRQLQEKAK